MITSNINGNPHAIATVAAHAAGITMGVPTVMSVESSKKGSIALPHYIDNTSEYSCSRFKQDYE